MEIAGKYSVYFATERGVVGSTQCRPGERATYELKGAGKGAEVTSMEWGRTGDEIIVGQRGGAVRLYDSRGPRLLGDAGTGELRGTGPVVGAEAVIDRIVVARSSGDISVCGGGVIDGFKADADGTTDCMKCNVNRKNVIGVGGEGNGFRLWDVERKECIFKAKSMGHDSLNLPIPTTIRGIAFFESDDKLSACCTREGHVLLYDERAQRRPVSKVVKPNCNFTTMASLRKDRQFAVGTSVGALLVFDFAKPARPVRSFAKFSGGVSGVACQPPAPHVFSVSLDRYLRVHDLETGRLAHSEYLKQGLTKVLVKPAARCTDADSDADDKDEVRIDEEYDKLFDDMEVVGEMGNKRGRRNGAEEVKRTKKI